MRHGDPFSWHGTLRARSYNVVRCIAIRQRVNGYRAKRVTTPPVMQRAPGKRNARQEQ